MNRYTLIYQARGHESRPIPVDGAVLRPDTLCPLNAASLAATPFSVGRTHVPLADLFDIEGPDPWPTPTLRVIGAPPLDHLGANMAHGELAIIGDAGDDLGASMTGGLIRVTGNAGHRIGGPHPTIRRGMSGGEILVEGNAGDFAGFLMRRGLIAIGGATGRSPGYRMLAGTLVLLTAPPEHPGVGMQRGTMLYLRQSQNASPGPHLSQGATLDATAMPALLLVLRRLCALRMCAWFGDELNVPDAGAGRWRRWSGDRFELNKGEVLQWVS